MENLLQAAHINVLPSFQNTGIKLKLINSLFKGRFVITNNYMIKNTGLEQLCTISNSKEEFITEILNISKKKFTNEVILKRENILSVFNTSKNALKIYNLI